MLKQFIKTSKGFKIGIGVEYALILGLSILLAWLAYKPLVAWNNKWAIAIVTIVLFIIGVRASKRLDPKIAFVGQFIALVPIATALRVLLGGADSLFYGLMAAGAGIVVAVLLTALDFNLFKDKLRFFIAMEVVTVGCYVLALVFKWLQKFDLVTLIIVFVIGALYADCWYISAKTHPKTYKGLVDAGSKLFNAPFGKIAKLWEKSTDEAGKKLVKRLDNTLDKMDKRLDKYRS